MTDQEIINELRKDNDTINLSIISHWLRRNLPESIVDSSGNAVDNLSGIVARRLLNLANGREFYRVRHREFDKLAHTLPEPYASQAFDILANGKIASCNETKEPQP